MFIIQNYTSEILIAIKIFTIIETAYMFIRVIYHLKDNKWNSFIIKTYFISAIFSLICFISAFFVLIKWVLLLCVLPIIPIILRRMFTVYKDIKKQNKYDAFDLIYDLSLITPVFCFFILFLFVK